MAAPALPEPLPEEMARALHAPLGLPGSGRQRYAAAMWFHAQGLLSPRALEVYRMLSPRDGDDPAPLLGNEPRPPAPEGSAQEALSALRQELIALLRSLDGPGIAETRAALAAAGGPATAQLPASGPAAEALHRDLPAALAALAVSEPALASSLAEAAEHLGWQTYDYPPGADIGDFFPRSHAYCALAGEERATWPAEGLDVGLLLVSRRVFYRDHAHPSPELYLPLTGPHGWRFHPGAPMASVAAFAPIWNEPNAPHAILTGNVPLLCLYAWLAEPQAPSTLVPAPDWASFEA
ncbi:dimethylsulfonioproprionate lyase family protein [Pseudoroseicyclus sp. H15]